MFVIETISVGEGGSSTRIRHPESQTYAKIDHALGGSLQELVLNDVPLIRMPADFSYAESKASALLFPFVNRLEDGRYEFEGHQYQLPINHPESHAALHGLVFDKCFEVLSENADAEGAELILGYEYDGGVEGFPHPFFFQLAYGLSLKALKVTITASNTGSSNFPFTVGWHPYFLSENLAKSRLLFNTRGRIESDAKGLGKRLIEQEEQFAIDLQDVFLDDCYMLAGNQAELQTPGYTLRVHTTGEAPFMQFFTPPYDNLIAIEPTSGASNSFIHGVGLRVLSPGEQYSETWSLSLF